MRLRRPVHNALAAAALVGVVAACGSDDDSGNLPELGDTGSATATPTATTGTGAPATEAPASPPPTQSNVSAPEGLDAAQQEVVAAYGQYIAAVDRLVRDNDLAASGIEASATGAQLDVWRQYAEASRAEQLVSEGPPLTARILSVTVDGARATMPVCLDQSFWVDVVAGVPTPLPPLVYWDVTMVQVDGRWRAAEAIAGDATTCQA